MVNKFEAFGIALSIGAMATALWLVRLETTTDSLATITNQDQSAAVFIADGDNSRAAVADAYVEATDEGNGPIKRMIIDDVVIGGGEAVVTGDNVSVHYIGTLQSGQQFDNSYEKGAPFSFEVGAGRVIKGWDDGVVGMKVGGQRILVIPSDLAYGDNGFGPIPGGATLVFAIELLAINE